MAILKTCLKSLRGWVPLNHLATGVTKWVFRTLNRPSPPFAIRHLPRSGSVTAVMPNGSVLRLWSRGDDGIANQVYWRGWSGHEPEALPLFFALAEDARVVLDIGAHVGLYSLTASYANPRASVFAFEPLDCARERLASNVRLNQRQNIEVIPSAVSDQCGVLPFYRVARQSTDIPTSSSLSRSFMMQARLTLVRIDVPVTTIDEFCHRRDIAAVSLAKLDIESLEPEAIRGMRRMIERSHPHLFVEILDGKGTADALDGLARDFGYHVFSLQSEGPCLQRKIETSQQRRNFLFTAMSPAELYRFMDVRTSTHMRSATALSSS